jgi:hypothetical protein
MKTAELLRQIWQQRVNQNIDSSLILFDQIKEELSLPFDQTIAEASEHVTLDLELLCDLLALENSLSRALRKPQQSQDILEMIDKKIPYRIQIQSFYLQFEKAVTAFTQSDWSKAVDHFQKAKSLAKTEIEKGACLANLILCFETLEIPLNQHLGELKEILKSLEGILAEGIRSQMLCLELRESWRRSDYEFLKSFDSEKENISQASYFKAFLAKTPYLSDMNTAFSVEKFVLQPGHLFNKEFRLRTLTAQFLDQDVSLGRLTDFVERLYLGTWQWLVEPSAHRLQFLVKSIALFPWDKLASLQNLSIEDQSLLILSFGWLQLFDHRMTGLNSQLTGKLRFTEVNKTLIAERNAQILVHAGVNPVTNMESKIAKIIQYRKSRLENKAANATDTIVVDFSNHQIFKNGQCLVQSKAIALALKQLKFKKALPLESFFSGIMGNIDFDHFLHQPQISNLIYKINLLTTPHFRLRQKDGMVSLVGNEEILSLVNFDIRHEILANSRQWQSCCQQFKNYFEIKNDPGTLNMKRIFSIVTVSQTSFSRQDIQRIANISKSESHRLITEWKNRGWIRQVGFGKKTIYLSQNEKDKSA